MRKAGGHKSTGLGIRRPKFWIWLFGVIILENLSVFIQFNSYRVTIE